MAYPLQLKQPMPVKQKLRLLVTEVIFNLVSFSLIGCLRLFLFLAKRITRINNHLLLKTGNAKAKKRF